MKLYTEKKYHFKLYYNFKKSDGEHSKFPLQTARKTFVFIKNTICFEPFT